MAVLLLVDRLGDSSIARWLLYVLLGDSSISSRWTQSKWGLQYGEDGAEHLDRADGRPRWRRHFPVRGSSLLHSGMYIRIMSPFRDHVTRVYTSPNGVYIRGMSKIIAR